MTRSSDPDAATAADSAAVSPDAADAAALARAYARCFAAPDGARVLADLEATALGRALGPGADEAALRHLEGQRALVLRIRVLAGRGRRG